jgi:hypothetical protein
MLHIALHACEFALKAKPELQLWQADVLAQILQLLILQTAGVQRPLAVSAKY